MEEEKKRNLSTNTLTCTSVVRAHRGADKKAKPRKTSSSLSLSSSTSLSTEAFSAVAGQWLDQIRFNLT